MTAQDVLENKFNYSYSSRKMFTYNELISFGIEFAKYYAGETGYIKREEWEEILNNII